MCCKQFVILLSLLSTAISKEARFENVEINGYDLSKLVYSKKIEKAFSLTENLPKNYVDKLVISGNIPVLHEGALNLKELDELVMENCKIREIQPGAINVGEMRKLSLNRNLITEIKPHVFSNLSLFVLDLSKNNINKIDSNAFNDMSNLMTLNLGWNNIDRIDSNWFRGAPELTHFTMHHNSIQEVPDKVFHYLAENRNSKQISTSLGIVLDHNKIKTVHPGAFKGLKEIEMVWLHDNLLQGLDENTWESIHLRQLTLGNNNITCFEGDLDKILSADKISVEPNPFDCACLEKLMGWSKQSKKSIDLFYADNECKLKDIRRRIDNLNKAFDNY
ncbi:unnamed protein product [Brassicogethes aeneus]|uniref:Uncharacterized protein n=1 Tax=Brassicogethes aeneus TaxID=1431903 RepID=A0A9P0FHM2_BRAAE|nr:unnamed protein product [Brassicogethes aeneus]